MVYGKLLRNELGAPPAPASQQCPPAAPQNRWRPLALLWKREPLPWGLSRSVSAAVPWRGEVALRTARCNAALAAGHQATMNLDADQGDSGRGPCCEGDPACWRWGLKLPRAVEPGTQASLAGAQRLGPRLITRLIDGRCVVWAAGGASSAGGALACLRR